MTQKGPPQEEQAAGVRVGGMVLGAGEPSIYISDLWAGLLRGP